MRLIDADALKSFYGSWSDENTEFIKAEVDRFVDLQITVDAEPVRHGHWIPVSTTKRERTFKCSVCRNVLDFDGVNAGRGYANRCPNCGAKMDEEDTE